MATLRRRLLFAGQAAAIVLIVLTIYFGRGELSRIPRPSWTSFQGQGTQDTRPSEGKGASQTPPLQQDRPPQDEPPDASRPPAILSTATIKSYVDAVMRSEAAAPPRLECPPLATSRYDTLRPGAASTSDSNVKFFFALDLRECLSLLPRLLGSVVQIIRLLGPEQCALSIVEGHSPDGTYDVLQALRPELDALTTTYYLRSSDINPKEGDRIEKLAELRNLALQPMWTQSSAGRFTVNTTVVFLNDVAICPEDILELMYQREIQGADMTCAFDWTYVGHDPTFYDVWVARGMNGDTFFEIPPDGNWNSAWNLFWNNPEAQGRFNQKKPFQVFSCWNGAVVFPAAPLLDEKSKIRFRKAQKEECYQGEPQLFCKDMWFHGYGKIAVIPAVNLEYSDDKGRQIKVAKGYTSATVGGEPEKDGELIRWQASPPDRVKCMATYENQEWQPWNQSLPL